MTFWNKRSARLGKHRHLPEDIIDDTTGEAAALPIYHPPNGTEVDIVAGSGYGSASIGVTPANASVAGGSGVAGVAGGNGWLYGGNGNDGEGAGSGFDANGGGADGSPGRVGINTDGSYGNTGDSLISGSTSGGAVWRRQLIRTGAGAPTGAPTVAELPLAFDSTPSTGGLYFWNGSAWVKGANIT